MSALLPRRALRSDGTFRRIVASTYEGIARLNKEVLAWRLREHVRGTRVLFKGLLGEAIEGEGGDGAFEMRCGDAPSTVGATPAGEFITFDPDQAFIHTSASKHAFGIRARARRGGTHQCIERGRWTPARRRIFSTESPRNQVTNVLRPVSRESTPFFGV